MSDFDTYLIDAEILARVINPERGDLPPEMAEMVLNFDFQPADRNSMQILSEKASLGELTDSEREMLDGFIRVGHFLGMLKSKARVSLKKVS